MSNEIFRFLAIRQPQRPNPDRVEDRIVRAYNPLGSETEFHLGLARLKAAEESRQAFDKFARQFIDSNSYFFSVIAPAVPLLEMEPWFARQTTPISHNMLENAVTALFGTSVEKLLKSDDFLTTRGRVSDSLMAVAMVPKNKEQHGPQLMLLMRFIGLLEKSNADPKRVFSIQQILRQVVLLPQDVFPLPKRTDPSQKEALEEAFKRDQEQRASARKKIEGQVAQLEGYKNALQEIRAAFSADTNDLRRKLHQTGDAPSENGLPQRDEPARGGVLGLFQRLRTGRLLVPPGPSQRAAVLSEKRAAALSGETKEVLKQLDTSESFIDVVNTMAMIEKRIAAASARLYKGSSKTVLTLIGNQFINPYQTYGGDRLVIDEVDRRIRRPGACVYPLPQDPFHESPTVPDTIGFICSIGTAELLQVRQEIQYYRAAEVAHIENILDGEYKNRTHRHLQRTEETFLIESEDIEETSRDLQTSERFELQQEATDVINEEAQLETGVTVTASYGPSVEVTANANYAKNDSREEMKRTARNYSREVVDRTVSRVQERVLERRSGTIVDEVEEINRHGFDNRYGGGHVRGIYRWVNKVYKAQIVSYGLRDLLEFIVPEPAAFYKFVQSAMPHEGSTIEKPDPPGYCVEGSNTFLPLAPEYINESEYLFWVGKYNVTGVEPPPPTFRRIGVALKQGSEEQVPWGAVTETNETLEIPNGYQAVRAWFTGNMSSTFQDSFLGATIGQVKTGLNNDIALNSEDDKIPIAIIGWGVLTYAAVIQILCEVTEEAVETWQMETYDAIMSAYQDQKEKYEAQLAQLEVQQGIAISGRNPLINREIEKVELKRAALTQLTGQSFDVFDAMRRGQAPHGFPEMEINEAEEEGKYIQFFEQAMEWNHMMYRFYPYFWGRKEDWPVNLQLNDTDPLFTNFLQAGAARIQIPIRPGYEEAVFYFVETKGEIWEGGDTPHVEDTLYVSIVDEIREDQEVAFTKGKGFISVTAGSVDVTGVDTEFDEVLHFDREIIIRGERYRIEEISSSTTLKIETPYQGVSESDIPYEFGARYVGDPWDVTVPTSLVYLQADGDLPDFTAAGGN
jgi:hypothetical protein